MKKDEGFAAQPEQSPVLSVEELSRRIAEHIEPTPQWNYSKRGHFESKMWKQEVSSERTSAVPSIGL